MNTVEISVQAGDLSAAMAEMRICLDERRFEPAAFSCRDAGAGVVIRVDFIVTTEAEAFAGRFRGRADAAGSSENRPRSLSPRQSTM